MTVNINQTKHLIEQMNNQAYRANIDCLAMEARVLKFYAKGGGRILGSEAYYRIKGQFRKRYFLLFGNTLKGFSRNFWNTDMDGRR